MEIVVALFAQKEKNKIITKPSRHSIALDLTFSSYEKRKEEEVYLNTIEILVDWNTNFVKWENNGNVILYRGFDTLFEFVSRLCACGVSDWCVTTIFNIIQLLNICRNKFPAEDICWFGNIVEFPRVSVRSTFGIWPAKEDQNIHTHFDSGHIQIKKIGSETIQKE